MSLQTPTRLERFQAFVAERIRRGNAAEMTPEEALVLWREKEKTLAAVREGLADIEAGRTWPAEDVLRELRQELADQ